MGISSAALVPLLISLSLSSSALAACDEHWSAPFLCQSALVPRLSEPLSAVDRRRRRQMSRVTHSVVACERWRGEQKPDRPQATCPFGVPLVRCLLGQLQRTNLGGGGG